MIAIRQYHTRDRSWVEETNLRFYQTAHGFDGSFCKTVKDVLNTLEKQVSHPGVCYLVAEAEKQPIGCIFLSADNPDIGRIRLFYVDAPYRGQGIGGRLLRDVVTASEEYGYGCLRVSTFDRHPEACRLYERFGFTLLRTTPLNAFGQTMKQIDYALELSAG
ncbi:MAG: GNAT family N-acetyltransferase [Pseudomonadota bacterium]